MNAQYFVAVVAADGKWAKRYFGAVSWTCPRCGSLQRTHIINTVSRIVQIMCSRCLVRGRLARVPSGRRLKRIMGHVNVH